MFLTQNWAQVKDRYYCSALCELCDQLSCWWCGSIS